MRNIVVRVQGTPEGILDEPYTKIIPENVKIIGMQMQVLPDGTLKNFLVVKPYGAQTLYLDETLESFTEIIQGECCAGSGGGSGGGGLFTVEITTEATTFQDDRLIGTDVSYFVLSGTSYQLAENPSGPVPFSFDSGAGEITLTTPPFSIGDVLTVFFGKLNFIIVSGLAGVEVQDARLVGRTVGVVVINNTTMNTGFTKLLASDTLTFTDGTTLTDGDTVTLILN